MKVTQRKKGTKHILRFEQEMSNKEISLTNKEYESLQELFIKESMPDDNNSISYKECKITKSARGFHLNIYDGISWKTLFTAPNVAKCKDFLDKFFESNS